MSSHRSVAVVSALFLCVATAAGTVMSSNSYPYDDVDSPEIQGLAPAIAPKVLFDPLAAGESLAGVQMVDQRDSSRRGTSTLKMVMRAGSESDDQLLFARTAILTAVPRTRSRTESTISWFINGRVQATQGPSLTYSAFREGITTVTCVEGPDSITTQVVGVDGHVTSNGISLDATFVPQVRNVLNIVNGKLGLSGDDKVKFDFKGTYSFWNVDKRNSFDVDVSKKWELGGEASLEVKSPALPVAVPTPFGPLPLELTVGLKGTFGLSGSVVKDASVEPPLWQASGSMTAGVAVTAELGKAISLPFNVLKAKASVSGSLGLTVSGTIQPPPTAQLSVSGNAGQFDISGQIELKVIGTPQVVLTRTVTVFNGFPIKPDPIPLSNLFN